MKIQIINKAFSLGGSSKVLNEKEEPLLKVKGRFFSMTRKKWIKDLNGKKLYMVRQKLISPIHHTAFIFNSKGEKLSEVTSNFLSFSDNASITSSYGPITISRTGDAWGDYSILVNNEKVGAVTRQMGLTNRFLLEIDESKYDWPYFVALVICLDNIRDSK